jgi:phage gp36-like protein
MPYLTPSEINTHLYGEVNTENSRGDNTLLQAAMNAAIEEARGYLTAYDINAVFEREGDTRNPILLLYVKDITVWHYIQLANPSVDMQLRLERYEKAIKWLEKVQSGKTNPNLPYPAVPPPDEPNNYMKWGSIYKRNNNF